MSHNITMFAERLRELRLEKGLTQLQLAEALGVDRTTVLKWETADRETNFAMLIKIARYFEVTCDYLIGNKDY